ncbi:MAG: hypothetical protein RIC87_21550 [Kiloniellales bacterium]
MFKRALCAVVGGLIAWVGVAGAQQNDYGGYDILGTLESTERAYGTARGWTVSAAKDRGRFAYCVGAYDKNGYTIRIGYDGRQWQLAVPGRSTPDWEGTFEVDGDRRFSSGTAVGDWTIAWLGLDEVDRVARGKHAELTGRTAYYSFPLTGTAATITKIEECVERQGVVAAAPAVQSRPQQPATPPRSLQGRGEANCFTKTWGPYRCRITDLAPEQGYHRTSRIDPINFPTAQSFFVRYLDSNAEVWTANPGDAAWGYLGVWAYPPDNQNCIEPIGYGAQSPQAQSNLGQSDWNLCVQ